MKSAFVSAIDSYLKQQGKYQKNEAKITFNDIQDAWCWCPTTSPPRPPTRTRQEGHQQQVRPGGP